MSNNTSTNNKHASSTSNAESNNSRALFDKSAIYVGNIIHRRFLPKKHSFNYRLYMLALDVSDIEKAQYINLTWGLFGFSWYHPLRFYEKDYLRGEPFSLFQRISNKVQQLKGHNDIQRIVMLVQVRCFGIYFSPANFYFCYDQNNNCTQMLAEVSNTPWNERHYYLVNLLDDKSIKTSKKVFQVSPFMDLNMAYFWEVIPPNDISDKLRIKIENKRDISDTNETEKLFDASLIMKKRSFSKRDLMHIWAQLPLMTVKVVLSIYWQAMKLFFKRIPFIGYQKTK